MARDIVFTILTFAFIGFPALLFLGLAVGAIQRRKTAMAVASLLAAAFMIGLLIWKLNNPDFSVLNPGNPGQEALSCDAPAKSGEVQVESPLPDDTRSESVPTSFSTRQTAEVKDSPLPAPSLFWSIAGGAAWGVLAATAIFMATVKWSLRLIAFRKSNVTHA